jgi:hypothetical protein
MILTTFAIPQGTKRTRLKYFFHVHHDIFVTETGIVQVTSCLTGFKPYSRFFRWFPEKA